MVSSLASLLFLGIVPSAAADAPAVKTLPGIEVVHVSSVSDAGKRFVLPEVSAQSLLLVDAESGEEIGSINPDSPRSMASLTKIMTALLILEEGGLHRVATIPRISENIGGSQIGLRTGEKMSIDSLLHALLISSANDAAYALATTSKGGVQSFVSAMNERAQVLGLKHTLFGNPAGLDIQEQYSTARDLLWLTQAALKYPHFREIINTRQTVLHAFGGRDFGIKNTNEMLHYNPHVHGVKTGTTTAAGECLIILAESHGREYLLVLLGSEDRYTDALRVLEALHEAGETR